VWLLAAAVLSTSIGSRAASSPPASKSPLPAASAAQPEFGGQCAMALAEGSTVATDCSVKWTAPDGKVYCFANEKEKKRFLDDPQGNIERARNFLAASEVDINTERMAHYESADVQTFVTGVITDTASKNAGVYPFFDPVSGQRLKLVFDHVDFVRTLAGYGFFPDVAFTAQDDPAKKYLIDFWVKPTQDKLEVFDTRIYKAPKRDGTGWMMTTRQPIP
jgi:YHS domain-containing protein